MDITKTFSLYIDCLEQINEYFDNVLGGASPELNLDNYWRVSGNSIEFDEEPFDEANYSYDIRRNMIWRKSLYTLVGVDDGCGNDFYVILDNSKKIPS